MAYKSIMERDYKARSGITLGGMGTGGIELRKDGIFYNWHIFNNLPYGTGDKFPYAPENMLFFIVRYQEEGKNPKLKVLQIEQGHEVAAIPLPLYIYPWLSGVDKIEYTASFPFVKMRFTDEEMPFDIEMEAFSPFIPNDVRNSTIPGIVFNFAINSKSDKPVEVILMATMRSGVGYNVKEKSHQSRIYEGKGFKAFEMSCQGMKDTESSFGYQAMASLAEDSTYYLGWEHLHPYYETVLVQRQLPNIDDTSNRIKVDAETGFAFAQERIFSTIAVSRNLKEKGSLNHTFIMGWNFPNLYARDTSVMGLVHLMSNSLEGNYYANFYNDGIAVVEYLTENLNDLYHRTKEFHGHYFDSSLEDFILDQVNSHLNTFLTSSWLTRDFKFGIEEGLTPLKPWGPLATIDVALYGSTATAALFPELDKAMLRAHRDFQVENGMICHGITRNFDPNNLKKEKSKRLDLPSQYALMVLRCGFWDRDQEFLQEMWPSVKKALDYVLRERDHNGDGLPDMEGVMCTYDNFPMYGASSLIASQWLAALRYAVEAAKILGDSETEKKYEEVYAKGRKVMEEKLWNGQYYILYNDRDGSTGDRDEGCLTDQIIGQWTTHFTGLGDILDKERIKSALKNIFKLSYSPEIGLCNCRWPEDSFVHPVGKDIWVDQANTCWTGVELAFASFLIYEGLVEEGKEIIRNVDHRYKKAGMYFDHQEFGGHYYRAMSSWAILNAMLGLTLCNGKYTFAPKIAGENIRLFFAFPGGTARYSHDVLSRQIRLLILSGEMAFRELTFECPVEGFTGIWLSINEDKLPEQAFTYRIEERRIHISFTLEVKLNRGQFIKVELQ